MKFNKAVDETTLSATDITIDGTPVDSVELSADGKTVTATKTAPLTNKTNYRVVVNGIQTVSGEDFLKEDKIVYVSDSVAPTLKSTEYVKATNSATVTFSEPLATVGTVTLTDKNGVTTTVTPTFTSGNDNAVISTSGLADGTYTAIFVGATDIAGNYFAGNKLSTPFTVGSSDTVKPLVNNVKVVGKNLVEVTFSEKLSNAGTVALNGGSALPLSADSKLDTAGDYKVDATKTVYTINVGNLTNDAFNTLTFASQVDNAGNTIDGVTKTVSYLDKTAPKLVDTKVVGSNVTLTFDENVTLSGTESAKFLAPNGVLKTIAASDIAVSGSNPKQVVVNLGGYISEVQSGTYSLSFAKDDILDADSNSVAYSTTFGLSAAADTVKPEINDANTAGVPGNILYSAANGTVTVQYSEAMGASAKNPSNYTVDGQQVFESAYFDGNTSKVVLKLKDNQFSSTANRQLKISDVSDAAGNVLKDAPYTESIQFTENVKPSLLSAVVAADGTKLTLTFSESLADATIGVTEGTQTADFQVLVDGVAKSFTNELAVAGTNNTKYDIVLGTALTPSEIAKTITLKPLTGIDVTDTAGNALTSFTTFTVAK